MSTIKKNAATAKPTQPASDDEGWREICNILGVPSASTFESVLDVVKALRAYSEQLERTKVARMRISACELKKATAMGIPVPDYLKAKARVSARQS